MDVIDSICYVNHNLGLLSMEMNDCCQVLYFAECVLFIQKRWQVILR